MRRILVPLDGTPHGESVLPDACDLAGPDGELVLLHVVGASHEAPNGSHVPEREVSETYLAKVADRVARPDLHVRTMTIFNGDVGAAIETAAAKFDVEMIACATHARGPAGRLIHGGVVWKAIANSSVPVMLRRVADGYAGPRPTECHVMVALDGSEYAEKALPIAERLAMEWNAKLTLVRAVVPLAVIGYGAPGTVAADDGDLALEYLHEVSRGLGHHAEVRVVVDSVIPGLVQAARSLHASHVVVASHGRTGLSRVILGSVADGLVHSLDCAVIVIPAMAPGRLEEHEFAIIPAGEAKPVPV